MTFRAHITVTILLTVLSCSSSAFAECVYPKTPDSVPNGATASDVEMQKAKTQLDQYKASVEAYVACLDEEIKTRVAELGDKVTLIRQIKVLAEKKRQAVTDELTARVQEYEQQMAIRLTKK